uniref:Integrase catalytic domain-containing protein n=1 Tax=Tanacetum cinerariifolium TaxID=118510 RepID=A0A6L2KM20_TANCI|nr:hypothetical protein [Tanacetum cinerariifolium]
MHSIGKTLTDLHAMLKLHEKGILKKAETSTLLAIREGKIQKDKKKLQGAKGKAKGKNKLAYAPKTKILPLPKRDNLQRTLFATTIWRTHICNTSQGIRRSRKLKTWSFKSVHDNEMHAAIEAIRSFNLILPSGLIIVLDNCHFAPTVTRGIVSVSCLVKNNYIYTFTNYGIFVSKDNVFYFSAIPCDDIYEIDMHNLYPNVSFNFNISNKRIKHGLDSYYLWHCHLGHIKKKCIDMLQRDGLLQPTHDESHEKCKSYISGKMACQPFSHQVERAKDLLGLIHTDVCGPFRTMSREGANYFITFTNDFSRYSFVYLMKHKYEVFETFKVFQNEVENQLSKNIKAIRSDRGGKYLSHKFVNHIKSYGIISQLNPPYTPQHKRTASRILNMVPTKKIDMTPNEIWHGKARNLSYLRVWGSSGSHGLLEISGSDKGLKIIQEEYTQPSKNTSKEHDEVAPIKVEPQNVRVLISRSTRIPHAPDRYGYYADTEEYEFEDFNEPPNYKATLADLESNKWLEVMNTKISKRLIALSQSAYLEKILKKIRIENSKKGYTPMMEKPKYRKSQGAKTPTETRYVFVLNGRAVDWKSAKQSTTVMSSIEAEYIAAAEASLEAVWMRKFIDGLGGVMPSNKRPIKMPCDNEPALAIARDPRILKGAKHFQRKYHYIREVIQRNCP